MGPLHPLLPHAGLLMLTVLPPRFVARQASHNYAASLDVQPGNPQALNNWGLVLQVRVWQAGWRALSKVCD